VFKTNHGSPVGQHYKHSFEPEQPTDGLMYNTGHSGGSPLEGFCETEWIA